MSGSSFPIHRARTSRFLLSSQTKSFCAIKNALLRPARWAFHAHGISLRPFSKQARRSAGAHSRCRRAAPSASTVHAARVTHHHRTRRSVPSSDQPTIQLLNLFPGKLGAFELSFTPRAGALDDVAVELYLGSGATGATCSGGEWMYTPARRTLRWSIAPSSAPTASGDTRSASAPGRTATLRGTFASSDAHPRPARAAQISFALPAGAPLSALKIDQLKLSGETYKPYKGVRGRAMGRVEWRVEWKGG